MDKENITVKTQSSGNLMVVSLILMVLSCVLFVGTTLAWFTDQTSGGVNRIQAGNLDAELWIGESEPLKVKLDSDSDTQPTNTTAVSLKLRKVTAENNVVTIAPDDNAVWNPGDIFISDVMRVVKASGSVPFDYKLELEIDPETEAPDENPAQTNDASDAGEEANAAESPTASDYIDFRIVDVSTISTVSNDTRTYDYSRIAACFPAPASQQKAPQNNSEETNEPTESTPIIWSSDNEEQTTPTNVFSSEPTENETQVQFVILARLKPNVSVVANSPDTIENPFNLVVTITQQLAAKAGMRHEAMQCQTACGELWREARHEKT